MPTIRANPHVSNAVLKALASGKANTISNTEWAAIKKTALNEIKTSGNPKATYVTVKRSLEMAKKTTTGGVKDSIDAFLKKELQGAVKDRQDVLKRQPSVWNGRNTFGGRS
jgi:hypothetical protein